MTWLAITQGLLTSIIAIITTYIAYQQYRATKLKIMMDRYDRRLKVYQETHRFITMVNTDSNPDLREMFEFENATAEADFIFPPEIRVYLDEVFSHANKLRLANKQYNKSGHDHYMVTEAIDEHTRWFIDQPRAIKEKFKPHMDIS